MNNKQNEHEKKKRYVCDRSALLFIKDSMFSPRFKISSIDLTTIPFTSKAYRCVK